MVPVLVLAPTGMAAYHIQGNTIHSGLHIPINQGEMNPLGSSELNTLRCKYNNVKVVFIDEISMVGSQLFIKIDQRLQQIFGCRKFCGGLHVIAVGDFLQMKPVKDVYIFKNVSSSCQVLAPNLFLDNFQMFTLDEIMRQQGQVEFCAALNRLRVGEMTPEDHAMFESRIIEKTSPEYKPNVRHVYPLVNSVRTHNTQVFNNCQEEKTTVHAHHTITGNPNPMARIKAWTTVEKSAYYIEINCLLRDLDLGVGLIYGVSCNLNTEDGLINGAECVLKMIEYRQDEVRPDQQHVAILWMEFSDAMIGRQRRSRYKNLYKADVHQDTWTPIFAVKRQAVVCQTTTICQQFPLRPSAGTTIHKCQGCSFSNVCVDMDITTSETFKKYPKKAKPHLMHSHYVAASRATSLEGLQIVNWNADLINQSPEVLEMMKDMRENKMVQLCYQPIYNLEADYKCAFLNTRSLHRHIKDVAACHNLKACDIIILAETRLHSGDSDDDYRIPGFAQMFRNDQEQSNVNRPSHGLIMYVKEGIQVLDQGRSISTPGFEAMSICVRKRGCNVPTQLMGVYVSPQCKWHTLESRMMQLFQMNDIVNTKTIILGDFNMKSIASVQHPRYNERLEKWMLEHHNMRQFVKQSTTKEGSILDLCFTANIQTVTTIWNHWSDHKIVGVAFNDIGGY